MNQKTDMREALQLCIDAMLHDGVPTDTYHPRRVALAAAEAALASRPDAQADERELLNAWYEASAARKILVSDEVYRIVTETAALLFRAAAPKYDERGAFQSRVQPWMLACFGAAIAADAVERNHRFFEEAAELVQACGMTASEAHQLVEYTWSRPIGEKTQEVGGVMVTLAALCLANGLDMHAAGETELARISAPETMAKIRAKQAAKPKHSPLPEVRAAAPQAEAVQGVAKLSIDELALIREEAVRITDDWSERQLMEPTRKETDAKFVSEILRLSAPSPDREQVAEAQKQEDDFDPTLIKLLRDAVHYADSVCGMLRQGGWHGAAKTLEKRIRNVIDHDAKRTDGKFRTEAPSISREHLVALGEVAGIFGSYRTAEFVEHAIGYARVVLNDNAVQEAFLRANAHLFASPSRECGEQGAALSDDAAAHSAGAQEPVAYLHEMHLEGDQSYERLTFDTTNAFGEPGRDYDSSYEVTCTPLYTHPQPMKQTNRTGSLAFDYAHKLISERLGTSNASAQTDAARDAFLALIAKVPHKPQAITYEKGWELLDELQRIAEIERIDRDNQGQNHD